ncbi:MAG: tape measure protein [Candidatus Riflebacteria bacterium]|nr:tape measure protein [Candidatus Riflebacteria bacterium]
MGDLAKKLTINVDVAGITSAISGFRDLGNTMGGMGGMSANVNGLSEKMATLEETTQKNKKKSDEWFDSLFKLNTAWDLLSKTVGVAKSVFDSIVGVGSSIASDFIQTSSTFEQLNVRFESVFGGSGPAERALDWAKEFGARTPLTMEEVTNQMIKLKTFGFDPMDGIMQKLGDTAYALGTDFDGVVTALGQMKLKGKVSAEELMQLTERNIPAIQILQDKFHLTAKQMENIGNAGIKVDDAIKTIVDTLGTKYAGAMQKASDTWAGSFSTIEDSLTLMKLKIMDSGPYDFLVSKARDVRDALSTMMDSKVFADLAKQIGGGITEGLIKVESLFKRVFSKDVFNEVLDGAAIFAAGIAGTFNDIIDKFKLLGVGTNFVSGLEAFLQFVNLIRVAINNILEAVSLAIEVVVAKIQTAISNGAWWTKALDLKAEDMEGLNKLAGGIRSLKDLLGGDSGLSDSFKKIKDFFPNINKSLDSWKIDLSSIWQTHAKIKDAIDNLGKGYSTMGEAVKDLFSGQNIFGIFDKFKNSFNIRDVLNIPKDMVDQVGKNIGTFFDSLKNPVKIGTGNFEDVLKSTKTLSNETIAQMNKATESAMSNMGISTSNAVEKVENMDKLVMDATRESNHHLEEMAKLAADKFKSVSETVGDAFKASEETIGKALVAYADVLKEGDIIAQGKMQIEIKEEQSARDKLIETMQDLADQVEEQNHRQEKEPKIEVTVDGADGAIKELIDRILTEAMIRAKSEGILVAGV